MTSTGGLSLAFYSGGFFINAADATFGCLGGTNDDTAGLRAALDAAAAVGAIVLYPFRTGTISDTITIDDHLVRIWGLGGYNSVFGSLPTDVPGTTFKWAGAAGGTMFEIRAGQGASRRLSGSALSYLTLDCLDVAACGLRIRSLSSGRFQDVMIRRPAKIGLDVTTEEGQTATPNTDQYCVLDGISIIAGTSGLNTDAVCARFTSAYRDVFEHRKTLTISATSGTFTLTFGYSGATQTTAGIAYNATGAAVQAALEALSNVDAGDVTVVGAASSGTDGVTNGTTAFTAASGAFTSADVGRNIYIAGVSYVITAVPNSTSLTLLSTALTGTGQTWFVKGAASNTGPYVLDWAGQFQYVNDLPVFTANAAGLSGGAATATIAGTELPQRGNTSIFDCRNWFLRHHSGNALIMGDSGECHWNMLNIGRVTGGTGIGVEVLGSNTKTSGNARTNYITVLQAGPGGFHPRTTNPSTGTSYKRSGHNIGIVWYTIDNATAQPSIDPGAYTQILGSSGPMIYAHGMGLQTGQRRDPRTGGGYPEDFDQGWSQRWTAVTSGTASIAEIASESGRTGIVRLSTGATNGSVATLVRKQASAAIMDADDWFNLLTAVRVGNATGDTKQTIRVGLGWDPSSGQPADGIYMQLTPVSKNISGITGTGTVATCTTATAHTLAVGSSVTIAGTADYNGTVTVLSVPTTTTFTFSHASTATDGAAGTITANGWVRVTRKATVETVSGQLANASTDWVRFAIDRILDTDEDDNFAGVVLDYVIEPGALAANPRTFGKDTNVPVVMVSPFIQIINTEAVNKTVDIDFLDVYVHGLQR